MGPRHLRRGRRRPVARLLSTAVGAGGSERLGTVGAATFAGLFAAQTGVLILAPLLPELAADLDVSVAAAGQLRTVTGFVAAIGALMIGLFALRLGLRALLVGGLALLAAGAVLSAVAPTFGALAAAQVIVGLGIAATYPAAMAGSVEWSRPEHRTAALATALLGPPLAWLVMLPLVGVTAENGWRWAWLLPAGLAMLAVALALRLPALPRAAHRSRLAQAFATPGAVRWSLGELLVFGGWATVIVYGGALLEDSYGLSVTTTGILLGLGYVTYVPGSLVFRRSLGRRSLALLVWIPPLAAVASILQYAWRPAVAVTVALMGAVAFLASGRSLAGSSAGLALDDSLRLTLMGLRTSYMQAGYMAGAALGGAALEIGGYAAVGIVAACLHLGASACYLAPAAARHASTLSP